jgi:hypothetical protein
MGAVVVVENVLMSTVDQIGSAVGAVSVMLGRATVPVQYGVLVVTVTLTGTDGGRPHFEQFEQLPRESRSRPQEHGDGIDHVMRCGVFIAGLGSCEAGLAEGGFDEFALEIS